MYQNFDSALLPRIIIGGIIDIGAYEFSGNTGILENIFSNNISIFPNPTSASINISIPNYNIKSCVINLYDMLGQKQWTMDNGQLKAIDNGQLTIDNNTTTMSIVNYQLSINVGRLSPGIYFLEVIIDGEKQVRKVVKL